ncbi:hypothetical protein PPERSA_07621 [Pseudocohnilembus persalinus]|uniref:Uncharacterized protein n=1 Tax=Pseudocohnilembus persalinus TaxID=266149 RepID=A0A0V0QIQ2_PSEPJ|nr:hypothetical protein PPERSA_07621 [Pseudocohnilembus persalinus]|eukprot:KRX01976.1 hypothetical protein PPERSA_07621 [Pseudocohnilembus persalinus]
MKNQNTNSAQNKVYESYHYVQGYNVQSAANVSLYVMNLINNFEKQQQQSQKQHKKWFSSGGQNDSSIKITKANFNIYDAFKQIEVRVEINIPGNTKLHAFTSENEQCEVNDELWERAYVSSCLRSMEQVQNVKAGIVYEEFQNLESFQQFIQSLFNVIGQGQEIYMSQMSLAQMHDVFG